MLVTERLKERFCKDCSIPIPTCSYPYFEYRLELYDAIYGTKEKYEEFLELIDRLENESEYVKKYTELRDTMISYLGNTAMKEFVMGTYNTQDFKFMQGSCIPNKDIYRTPMVGRTLMSIDMRKGNFTALRYYNPEIVGGAMTYEDFAGKFTDEIHFINSKSLRQIVFGHWQPKRQVSYMKYLMCGLLERMLDYINIASVVYLSTDEIVLDITNMDEVSIEGVKKVVQESIRKGLAFRIDTFVLRTITKEDDAVIGYLKEFKNKPGVEIKGVHNMYLPYVVRAYAGEDRQEVDDVFKSDGRLARFIDIPRIKIN